MHLWESDDKPTLGGSCVISKHVDIDRNVISANGSGYTVNNACKEKLTAAVRNTTIAAQRYSTGMLVHHLGA